jgi:hypothetical protein
MTHWGQSADVQRRTILAKTDSVRNINRYVSVSPVMLVTNMAGM